MIGLSDCLLDVGTDYVSSRFYDLGHDSSVVIYRKIFWNLCAKMWHDFFLLNKVVIFLHNFLIIDDVRRFKFAKKCHANKWNII